jgi:hypothetical protein
VAARTRPQEFIDHSIDYCEAARSFAAMHVTPAFFLSLLSVFTVDLVVAPAVVPPMVSRLVSGGDVILRVPVLQGRTRHSVQWVERDGPKCLPIRSIRAALLSGRQNVDFILAPGGSPVRAKVDEDCPALDFYGGLYLDPEDSFLCAKRDTIRSRMGGTCKIRGFKVLEPHPAN